MHIILCNYILTVENRSKDRYLFLREIEKKRKKIEFQQIVILNFYKVPNFSFFFSFHSQKFNFYVVDAHLGKNITSLREFD